MDSKMAKFSQIHATFLIKGNLPLSLRFSNSLFISVAGHEQKLIPGFSDVFADYVDR
jgi:hypothetical protein